MDVGQTVAASLQAPVIFTIANDLTKMQIDANVAEADVGGVAVDQDVDFTVDAFPTRTFHGKVVQVRNAPITVQNVVHLRHRHRRQQSGFEIETGHDRECFHYHRASGRRVEDCEQRAAFPMPDEGAAPAAKRMHHRARVASLGLAASARGGGRERRVERTVYVLSPGRKPTESSAQSRQESATALRPK